MKKVSSKIRKRQFQCFILKTLREKNKNTEGAIQKHCGSDLKTLGERESAPSVF